MTMKQEDNININDFMGYIYFLLNSDDGNIYVLSMIMNEDTKPQSIEFVLKDGDVNPETALVYWSDNTSTLVDYIKTLNITRGISIPDNFYEKADELLPIKVVIHRDKTTNTTTLTFYDNV